MVLLGMELGKIFCGSHMEMGLEWRGRPAGSLWLWESRQDQRGLVKGRGHAKGKERKRQIILRWWLKLRAEPRMDPKFLSGAICRKAWKEQIGGWNREGWRSKVGRGPELLTHLFLVFWSFLLLMSEFFRAGSKSFEDEMRYLEWQCTDHQCNILLKKNGHKKRLEKNLGLRHKPLAPSDGQTENTRKLTKLPLEIYAIRTGLKCSLGK